MSAPSKPVPSRPLARFYTRRRGKNHEVVDRRTGRILFTHPSASRVWIERESLTKLAMEELRPPRPD